MRFELSVARILISSGLLRSDTSGAVGAAAPASKVQPGLRQTLVIVYVVLALLALVPGIALKFGFSLQSPPVLAAYLDQLGRALSDIKFGTGLRFWLGVSGATMMGLLLLYPLRKVLFKARAPGSVGGWFHIHILFGLIGPVLILYHCNFELGGFNANVALWTMLAVAVSGIVGFFVYSRVSRDFYVTIVRARQLRKDLLESLPGLDQSQAWTAQLTRNFEAFENETLTPRQGVITSLRTRVRVEQLRRPIVQNVAAYLNAYANANNLSRNEYLSLRGVTGRHLGAYFSLARASASQSVREQLWSRWRLFHLPLFLIMVAAVVLHVVAVWGMDDPASDVGADASDSRGSPATVAAAPPAEDKDPIGTLLAQGGDASPSTVAVAAKVPKSAPVAAKASAPATQASSAVKSANADVTESKTAARLPAKTPAASDAAPIAAAEPAPRLVSLPQLVTNRARPPKVATQTLPDVLAQSTVPLTKPGGALPQSRPPISAAAFDEPPARPTRVAEAPAASVTPVKNVKPHAASASDTSSQAAIAELERRIEEKPMGLGMATASAAAFSTGLGGPGLRTLAEQIPHMKARMAALQFAHSEMETGFALTGKHLKAECTSCHTEPLREVRQSVARACVACHKKDDIHKGRRPQCVDCHTTNRWTQILRRK